MVAVVVVAAVAAAAVRLRASANAAAFRPTCGLCTDAEKSRRMAAACGECAMPVPGGKRRPFTGLRLVLALRLGSMPPTGRCNIMRSAARMVFLYSTSGVSADSRRIRGGLLRLSLPVWLGTPPPLPGLLVGVVGCDLVVVAVVVAVVGVAVVDADAGRGLAVAAAGEPEELVWFVPLMYLTLIARARSWIHRTSALRSAANSARSSSGVRRSRVAMCWLVFRMSCRIHRTVSFKLGFSLSCWIRLVGSVSRRMLSSRSALRVE